MWRKFLIVFSLMVLLASGCSESQRKTVDLAISAHPETKVQGQYEDVIVELTTARDIIQLRAPDMPLDDRVALQVAYVETIRTQAVFEQALSQPGGLDADALKNAIAMGLMAYERGSPVLLRNRELFRSGGMAAPVRGQCELAKALGGRVSVARCREAERGCCMGEPSAEAPRRWRSRGGGRVVEEGERHNASCSH